LARRLGAMALGGPAQAHHGRPAVPGTGAACLRLATVVTGTLIKAVLTHPPPTASGKSLDPSRPIRKITMARGALEISLMTLLALTALALSLAFGS
jgi:hypothetical protein